MLCSHALDVNYLRFKFNSEKNVQSSIRDNELKVNQHVKVRDVYLAVRILNGVYLSTTNVYG